MKGVFVQVLLALRIILTHISRGDLIVHITLNGRIFSGIILMCQVLIYMYEAIIAMVLIATYGICGR